jgi:excisionase family DNA binding protein
LSTQPALPRSLTKRQLAAELDVSIRTVDTWMQLRKIPYRKVGRMVRFDLDRVMAALDRYVIREIS